MTAPGDDTRSRAAAERELLARLGLTTDANSQMVDAAYDELVRFLETAPGDLRAWAQREIAAADEAYALLSDPTAEITTAATAAVAPAVAIQPTRKSAATAPVAPTVEDDEIDELSDEPVPVRRTRPSTRAKAPAAAPADEAGRNRLLTRLALVAAGLVGVVAIVFAVYNFGGGGGSSVPGFTGTPAPEASGPVIDQAQVAQLMQKLQSSPKDVATLMALGDVYYNGADYATAGTFFDKVLAIEPANVQALLGRGATAYNVGDRTVAEKDWRAAIAADPKNVDAHYYLGFMYLDDPSPDLAKVKAEWNKVIELDPTSDLAKTVATHLKSFESPAPGASGAPAGSAAPAASPSGSPAASPAASPAVSPAASPSASVK